MYKLPLILSAFLLIATSAMADVASEAEDLASAVADDAAADAEKSQGTTAQAGSNLVGAVGSLSNGQQEVKGQEVDSEDK